MTHYARVEEGVVVEVLDIPGEANIAEMYHPDFLATCRDCGSEVKIGWNWNGKTFNQPGEPLRIIIAEMVNIERNRRIHAGFFFGGKRFAFDADSKQRVTGAATLAGFAMAQGKKADDLLWHGGSDPFVWIADDNTLVPMDAPTCFAFGQAAAAHETAHIFAARQIKDASPIPADYADDAYWP